MSSNEALQTLVSVYSPTQLRIGSANFDSITSNRIDLSGGLLKATNGRFNYLNSNNLDVSSNINANSGIFNTITSNNIRGNITGETARFNNLTFNNLGITGAITGELGTFNQINSNNINGNIYGETGRFNNLEISNDLNFKNINGETGTFNNIITSEISGNNYFGNTATFNNLKTNILNTNITNFNTVSANNFCFGPNTNDCISVNSFNLLQLLNSSLYSYMYLPNTITSYEIPPTIVNDQNIIWSDISGYIQFPTIRPDAPIKNIPSTSTDVWQYWNGTANTTWNGTIGGTLWNGVYLYRTVGLTGKQSDGTGIQITVPIHPNKESGQDYSVLWIRLCNDRINDFKVYDMSGSVIRKYYGKHCVGNTSINNISPDGSTKSDNTTNIIWWPVPIDLSGNPSRNIMINGFTTSNSMSIGGIAFSTNPWNHCVIHADTLYNRVNDSNSTADVSPDNTTIYFSNPNTATPVSNSIVNSSYLMKFVAGKQVIIRIPFVNSQTNKIFYMVEQNANFGASITGAEINITPNSSTATWQNLGNFYTTFDNPFARHTNSKSFQKYYGIVIPKEYLPIKNTTDDNFIQLRITTPIGNSFQFSEVGTHDVNPFE